MDEDGLCIHDLEPQYCTICNGREQRFEKFHKTKDPDVLEFYAQYTGTCHACGSYIEVDQLIVKTMSGEYVHDTCAVR